MAPLTQAFNNPFNNKGREGESVVAPPNEMGNSKVTDKVARVLRASKMRLRPKLQPVINLKFRKIFFKKSSIGCLWVPIPKV